MKINYTSKIEVRHNVDVLVAGGGPAGVAAAIASSEMGADTLLIEATACLGGLGTAGMVPAFMHFSDGMNFLADGIGRKVLERMTELGGQIDNNSWGVSIKAEALKRAYDELVAESGAKFRLMTQMIDVISEDRKVNYIICSAKSGIFAIKAKVFIDATGDGDLCAWAGTQYKKGDSTGQMMAGTLCSLWSGIHWDKVKGNDSRELEDAFKDKIFTYEDRHLPGMWRVGKTLGGGNIGHTFGVDGTDECSVTKALVWGRKSISEYERYYKEYLVDGYEDMELVSTGSLLGIRETRRITGDYVLKLEDFVSRASFEDEIGRYCYPIDIHASDSTKKSFEQFHKDHTSLRYKKGESYGVPYRAIVPIGLDNVLMAGRCISTDRYMQSSIRVMPGCFITGQAAGVAAVLAISCGNNIRGFDIKLLQKELKDMCAYLPNFI